MQKTWAYSANGRARAGARAARLGRLPRFLLNAVFAVGTCVSFLALAAPAVPGLMGLKVMVVISGSMEPRIAVGDAVVIAPEGPIGVGDVITFQGYGSKHLTTHRVTKVVDVQGRTHYQTRGDANDTPDPNLASAEAVVGRVAFSLPKIGWLLHYGSTPRGRLVLLGFPVSVLLLQQGAALLAYRRSRREEAEPSVAHKPGVDGLEPFPVSGTGLADTWVIQPIGRRRARKLVFSYVGRATVTVIMVGALVLPAILSATMPQAERTAATLTDLSSVDGNTFSTGTW